MNQRQTTSALVFNNTLKGLINETSFCYANSTMQILLDLPEIRTMINELKADDPLRLFTKKYFTTEKPRFNPKQFYNKMGVVRPDGEQDDIESFLERLIVKYPAMQRIFGVKEDAIHNGDDAIEYRTGICIKSLDNVQEGINNFNIPSKLPNVLNVFISRFEYNDSANLELIKKPIMINNCVTVNEKNYRLKGIIIHTGKSTSGHFKSIILRGNQFNLIDDSIIYCTPPDNIDTNYINTNAVLCTYIRCDTYSEGFFDIEQFSQKRFSSKFSLVKKEHKEETRKQKSPKPKSPYDSHTNSTNIHGNALFIKSDNEKNLIDIPKEITEEKLDETWTNNVHDHTIKTNLHDTYLYLHGFINAALDRGPINDIQCSEPIYQKKFDVLSQVIKILGKCKFNYKETIGAQNAETTADTLQIQALIPSKEQAIEAADLVRDYIKRINVKKNPSYESMEEDINLLLGALISKIDSKDDCYSSYSKTTDQIEQDEENIFYSLGKGYNWKARAEELDISLITEKLVCINEASKETEETEEIIKRNALRDKLWNDFNRDIKFFHTKEQFVKDWIAKRNAGKLEDDLSFSENYAIRLLNKFLKNNGVVYTKKRGGAKSKLTTEALECLITTVFDFPDATDTERTDYINKYGPCENNNVCKRTINNALKNLKITNKKPSFSPKQRNCFGYRIGRILWAEEMKVLTQAQNTIICFIDEAGVVINKRKNARGFISVIPITNKENFSENISNIACIIPGFGVIYRWFRNSVRGQEYAKFIRDITYIIRNKICNEQTQIVYVNDNATIHKTKQVREMASKCKINLIYTVPYSPQTNLPAENYYCQMKHVVCYKFLSVQDEKINPEQSPIQHKFYSHVNYVLQQWDDHTKNNYDYLSTGKIYGCWLRILDDCIEGKALNGQRVNPPPEFNPKTVNMLITGKMKKECE